MKETPSQQEYKITVKGSDRYPSLEALQAGPLEPLAKAPAIGIRERRLGDRLAALEGKQAAVEREDGA